MSPNSAQEEPSSAELGREKCTKAPSKSLPPAAKQQLILNHLRASRTCHTLKDLEKCLPSVASINGMQVKDYIQALTDDGKLHVEKIGSGNWYWAWAGEEKKEREKVKNGLVKELEKLEKAVAELEDKKKIALSEIGDGGGGEERERGELLAMKGEREVEVARLRAEEERYLNGGVGGGIERKEADIKRWREEAEMWTDNIYVLEEYMGKLAGGDREIVESVKRECYGDEYVEGEGLRELQF
ncbi:hypothetical protein AJ79_04006 [Helicocarpus griseus UAMH5409]|uniref:Mnd1 HTH domain-containing protein n=1 Tax=Helicocarpus griseus UAMH5409 TaxID=1447875 RepID=A0A2B7XUL8_9EURO|nr:hypothetical protein AJ79_04006 [Helicocarpus griseus UAMH5409]